MRRREFIAGLGSALVWPATTYAQQPALPWVAYIGPGAPPDAATRFVGAFRTGLGDSGYFEGQNVSVEYHWLEGRFDRIPALVAELVPRRPAVIVTAIATALLALKTANTTIPVVFGAVDNPVRVGLVSSLARPGGNFTGINFFSAESASKRLGLMHDLVPKATHMAVLINPSNLASSEATLRQIQNAAPILGLSIDILKAGNSCEIDQAFADLARRGSRRSLLQATGIFRPDLFNLPHSAGAIGLQRLLAVARLPKRAA
jgi:putative tryptophan/tyrosine transport system substrate-binding protein